jgi:hypothetical protein
MDVGDESNMYFLRMAVLATIPACKIGGSNKTINLQDKGIVQQKDLNLATLFPLDVIL